MKHPLEEDDDEDSSDDSYVVDFTTLDSHFSTGSRVNKNKNKRNPATVNRRTARDNTKRTKHDDDISELSQCKLPVKMQVQRGRSISNDEEDIIDEEHDDDDEATKLEEGENAAAMEIHKDDAKFAAAVNKVCLDTVSGKLMTPCINQIRDPITKQNRIKLESFQREVMPKLKCQGATLKDMKNELNDMKESVEATSSSVIEINKDLKTVEAPLVQLSKNVEGVRATSRNLSKWIIQNVGNMNACTMQMEKALGCKATKVQVQQGHMSVAAPHPHHDNRGAPFPWTCAH